MMELTVEEYKRFIKHIKRYDNRVYMSTTSYNPKVFGNNKRNQVKALIEKYEKEREIDKN